MDIQYLLFLQYLRELTNGIFNNFFLFITDLGWSVLPLLVAAGMYWSINKTNGRFIFTTMNISNFFTNLFKLTACIYRPWIRSAEVHPVEQAKVTATGYSFPSGHTTVGTSLWGGIAHLYHKNKLLRNTCIVLVILICFSRNYLGVHTPQDVLVALAIVLCVMWLTTKLLRWVDADPSRAKWFLIGSILCAVFMVLYANLKSYPMDYVDGVLLVDPQKLALDGLGAGGELLGFGTGFYFEQKYVHFTTDNISTETRITRFMVGGLIYIFFFNALGSIMALILPAFAARLVERFIGYFFIIFFYPFCFTKYEARKQAQSK